MRRRLGTRVRSGHASGRRADARHMMQPWQHPQPQWTPPVPGALPPQNTDDHDLAALSPFWPKVAAALAAVAGLSAFLGSLQTWTTVEIESAMFVLPIFDALL